MFESDMAVEVETIDRLRRGTEYMRSISDITSAKIFEAILADEEHYVDYLETQLGLTADPRRPQACHCGGRPTRAGRRCAARPLTRSSSSEAIDLGKANLI